MNFVPLMDLALNLVLILMVSMIFIRHPGVSLKLPQTKTQEGAAETSKDLVVAVASDGAVYMDGKPVEPKALQSHITAMARRDKESRVLLKGDRAVVYDRVMDVMDVIRQAGLTRIVLQTDPKQGRTE